MDIRTEALQERGDQVVSTQELSDLGLSRAAIDHLVGAKKISRVRQGWYWIHPQTETWPADGYRARVEAAIRQAALKGEDIVLAGPAAAVWRGLPWVGRVPRWVTIAGRTDCGRSSRTSRQRMGGVALGHITEHRGARLTTVSRTIADVARSYEAVSALAIADYALHERLTTHDEIGAAVEGLAGHRGVIQARRIAALADGLVESPGESVSRYRIAMAGLPMPELQAEIPLRSGTTARVDFLWREAGVIGEFDGLVKYGGIPGADDAREVVIAEKHREDALRALDYQVFRWTWSEVWNPASTRWLTDLRSALTGRPPPVCVSRADPRFRAQTGARD